MTDLLSSVIAAHGGLDRWRSVRAIDVTFNFAGGLPDLKGYPGDRRPSASVDTKVQRLYFGDNFMLRRLDYVTDVLGGVAAQYCYDHVTIDGLVFPTLRRVVRRTPHRNLLRGLPP
jgi:hypothetical protein